MAGKSPSDLTEALKTLGLKSKEASVLSFLMKNYDHPVSQFDIERALELRQPYVSAALRTIEHNGWVDLTASPDRIAKDLKTQYLNRCEVLKNSVDVKKHVKNAKAATG